MSSVAFIGLFLVELEVLRASIVTFIGLILVDPLPLPVGTAFGSVPVDSTEVPDFTGFILRYTLFEASRMFVGNPGRVSSQMVGLER